MLQHKFQENIASSFSLNRVPVPKEKLASLVKEHMVPVFWKESLWQNRGENRDHKFATFPGITFKAMVSGIDRDLLFEFIYDSNKLDKWKGLEYLVESLGLGTSSYPFKTSRTSLMSVMNDGQDGDKALLALHPGNINGIDRFVHTNLLAERLGFVHPSLCASTVTHVADFIFGTNPQWYYPWMTQANEQMDAVCQQLIQERKWDRRIMVDGYEQTNYMILEDESFVCIDPVIRN